jgi:DNA-binding NarL/FixJ family response regulator
MASWKQKSVSDAHPVGTGSIRVLIVDDQEFMRRALRRLLEMQKIFRICGEAQDGLVAVEKAHELQPQVIVMDINMPGIDGLEATRRIHKALPNVEILIFTQHELLQVAQAAEDAGARGCLSKSEAAHQLVPALATISQHQPFFPNL